MATIVKNLVPPRTNDPVEMKRFIQTLCNFVNHMTDTANPITSGVVPRFNGDFYFESTAGDWWKSVGLTSADWEQITFAAGTVGDHGTLVGLTDDDHAQYLKEKANGGVAAEIPIHTHGSTAEAGLLDGQYSAMSYYFGVM